MGTDATKKINIFRVTIGLVLLPPSPILATLFYCDNVLILSAALLLVSIALVSYLLSKCLSSLPLFLSMASIAILPVFYARLFYLESVCSFLILLIVTAIIAGFVVSRLLKNSDTTIHTAPFIYCALVSSSIIGTSLSALYFHSFFMNAF